MWVCVCVCVCVNTVIDFEIDLLRSTLKVVAFNSEMRQELQDVCVCVCVCAHAHTSTGKTYLCSVTDMLQCFDRSRCCM